VSQKKLYNNLFCSNLGGKFAKTCFILISGNTDGELIAEFLYEPFLDVDGGLVVHAARLFAKTHGNSKVIGRQTLHTHKKTAAVFISS
jgi:hypothetical protein